MLGNVTALEGLHVTETYRDRSMQHICSRHAAWDPDKPYILNRGTIKGGRTASGTSLWPYTLHPTPYTIHPKPFTLHPTPYTLHPSPYTLYATLYTLTHAL